MLSFQESKTRPFFALLSLPATAMGFALSVQISALSWILTTQYGLEIHDVGLVWAAGPLAGIIGQVLIGVISDRVWFWSGRRRPFILIGGVIAALMLLALPNIGVITEALGIGGILGVAIAVALTLDLAINVSFNPTRSIIADVTMAGPERTRGYAWMQTVSGTFGVLAYAIGAVFDNYVLIYFGATLVLVFSVIPPLFIAEPRKLGEGTEGVPTAAARESKEAHDSLKNIVVAIRPLWAFLVYDAYAMTLRLAGVEPDHYYAEIALGIATFVLVARTLREDEAEHTASHGLAGFHKVIAAHSFSWIGIHTTFVYLIAYIQHELPGLSDIGIGRLGSTGFLVLNAVGALLPATMLSPLALQIGRIRTHVLCLSCMTAGYVGLYFFGDTPHSIIALMAVLGIGWAAIVSLPFAIVSQKVRQEYMGLYMGLFNLSVVLPQLVVSLGIALIVSRAPDKSVIFLISALALGVSSLAWSFVRER